MENLQATGLRIGNILSFSGEPVAINAGFIHDCDYWNKNPERQDAVSFENVKPIPLTDEWFEKFGFNRDYDSGSGWRKNILREWVYLCCDTQGYFEISVSKYSCPVKIKQVHQLQNLYFALTGEELTIKEDKL